MAQPDANGICECLPYSVQSGDTCACGTNSSFNNILGICTCNQYYY